MTIISPNRMKITNFASFSRQLGHLLTTLFRPLLLFCSSHLFFLKLSYFLTLSLVGHLSLSVFSKPRNIISSTSSSNSNSTSNASTFMPKQLDVFFTSVSAATVSSMSTVEMEVFSNSQLVILTILMVLGGEVFTSFLEIQLERLKLSKHLPPTMAPDQIDHELRVVPHPDHLDTENGEKPGSDVNTQYLKHNSRRYLGHVVLGYFLVVHIVGSILIYMYVTIFSSARQVLKTKGIKTPTFSVFTTVSTFANCGFVPTNENMIVFKDNSGLLLLLIPQILLGNTLYPVFLRFTIRVLERITRKSEFSFLLRNHREMGYDHLLSGVHSAFLALTVLGFIFVQFFLFCAMEWNSDAMDGMNWYQRFVASLFEVVNSRHTGESVVDISTISSAILVLFVIMMYLPPYTSFLPVKDEKKVSTNRDISGKKGLLEYFTLSTISYLAVFVILICITEREKMKNDPVNFNVLNIIIEVTSAYGNVGFSTGYSCKRRLNQEGDCIDKWYGFAGRWSSKGKFILIVVMFFGRLKKYSMKGGKAWKLS